jgi:hypothetical protein
MSPDGFRIKFGGTVELGSFAIPASASDKGISSDQGGDSFALPGMKMPAEFPPKCIHQHQTAIVDTDRIS